MKLDFNTVTKTDLRVYLVKRPNNRSAFCAFVDRYTSEASSTTYPMAQSPEEIQKVDNLIRQKLTQSPKSLPMMS